MHCISVTQKQIEEMLETVWRSMLGVRYGWIIVCDANNETEELSKSQWFHMMVAVMVATEDEAGTYRAAVAGGSVEKNDYSSVSRDLVEIGSRPTIVDEFQPVPHKPVPLVLREEKREMKMRVQQVPTTFLGGGGGLEKEQKKQRVLLSHLATMPKVETCEDGQAMLKEKKRERTQQTETRTHFKKACEETQQPQQKVQEGIGLGTKSPQNINTWIVHRNKNSINAAASNWAWKLKKG